MYPPVTHYVSVCHSLCIHFSKRITFGGFCFNITEVDERRILLVNAEKEKAPVSGSGAVGGAEEMDGLESKTKAGGSSVGREEEGQYGVGDRSRTGAGVEDGGRGQVRSAVEGGRGEGEEGSGAGGGVAEDYSKKSFLDGEWVAVEVSTEATGNPEPPID